MRIRRILESTLGVLFGGLLVKWLITLSAISASVISGTPLPNLTPFLINMGVDVAIALILTLLVLVINKLTKKKECKGCCDKATEKCDFTTEDVVKELD